MDIISNIKYVDAYYAYAKEIGETKLSVHEAYGYVEQVKDSIIVVFIKKRGSYIKDAIKEGGDIIKGLILPDTSIVSALDTFDTDILKNITENTKVKIEWRDVLYVANSPRYDCSIMSTDGLLYKIKKDHIVLKEPKTTRVYPKNVQKFSENESPSYLILPISFITKVEVIKI